MKRVLLLATLLSAPSCVVGRQDTNDPIDARIVKTLQPGVTTAKEVTEKLGAPVEVVQLGRRSAYRYDANTIKTNGILLLIVNLFGQDSRSDRVWVFFDENNLLTHVGATYGTHRTHYALPWDDVHNESDNAARDAERPGVGKQ